MVSTVIPLISKTFANNRIVGLSLFTALLMVLSLSVTAADIDVSVDRSTVSLTDSFQLTFSANTSPDDDPNFTPLEQDFEVLNQQKTSQLSWVNGSMNKSIQWVLNVIAKRSGTLQIPAISFGDDSSKPFTIMVAETPSSPALSNNDELFLEVEVSNTSPYIQSQVIYTVRLYQRVNFSQASISDVILEKAVIENLGEPTKYNTQIAGVNYLVTELKYALFPQQSGAATIEPLVLTAQVIISASRGFFDTPNTQTRRIKSKPIHLDVQASPSNFTGNHWLAAEQLALTQTWSNKDLQVEVGEPITRTLSLQAKGVTSSQLPNIVTNKLDLQLKVYPDQATLNDQKNPEGIIGKREQKVAIIPSKAGKFTLPAITVPWFNTRTNQVEMAQLPEVELVAIASQVSNAAPSNAAVSPTIIETNQSQVRPTSPEHTATSSNRFWMWLAIGLAIAWLITLAFLFKLRFAKTPTEVKVNHNPSSPKVCIKELKKACEENNPHAAQRALIKWGEASFQTTSLTALTEYCDATLQAELGKLNQALYAKQKSSWNGALLIEAILANQPTEAQAKGSEEPLASLYPS